MDIHYFIQIQFHHIKIKKAYIEFWQKAELIEFNYSTLKVYPWDTTTLVS